MSIYFSHTFRNPCMLIQICSCKSLTWSRTFGQVLGWPLQTWRMAGNASRARRWPRFQHSRKGRCPFFMRAEARNAILESAEKFWIQSKFDQKKHGAFDLQMKRNENDSLCALNAKIYLWMQSKTSDSLIVRNEKNLNVYITTKWRLCKTNNEFLWHSRCFFGYSWSKLLYF